MKLYKALWFACALTIAACGQKTTNKKEESQKEEGHGAHEEEGNTVSLTEEQMKSVGIEMGKVEMKNLTNSLSVNGTLAVPNQNKALVTSIAGGTLQSLKVQPGDFVKKGQIIGTIANTELSGMQQQLISVNAQIAFSEQELKRQQELVAGNAAPLKNLQKTEAELNGLRAQQAALKRQLNTLGVSFSGSISSLLTITAPISGTISEVNAQIGSRIDANSAIAEITNNSDLHLDLFVYEKDLPKIAKGQTIHFTLTNNPGKEYDAIVYSVGTAFINETKAVPVHANVVNDKSGLIEGMSVTARISLGSELYPAVPDDAIVNNGGKDYIFVLSSAEGKQGDKHEHDEKQEQEGGHEHGEGEVTFERIQIVKGASDVGFTEIKPTVGVAPGTTQVATKGSFFLMAKMTNTGEHEH